MPTGKKFTLKSNKNVILIENKNSKKENLLINKKTAEFSIQESCDETNFIKKKDVYGVYGLIELFGADYLIVIEEAKNCGKVDDKEVYEIQKVFCYKIKVKKSLEDDFHELKEIQDFFSIPGTYFSEYELFKSLQYQKKPSEFYDFNLNLRNNFEKRLKTQNSIFSTKCIHGYFKHSHLNDQGIILISRKSWKRVGARYFSRGSDLNGYVSNFIETEQIVYKGNQKNSFLQIRGSIPLKWEHRLSLKYKPHLYIDHKNSEVFKKSYEIINEMYGNIVYVNLIQSKGYEKEICEVFNKKLQEGGYNFIYFDFKNEKTEVCAKSQQKLESLLKSETEKMGFFSADNNKIQNGIFRTNCIDCLDRTNVAQKLIANMSFEKQLAEFGIENSTFENAFKEMWFENGNAISTQYSGTPSLKSELLFVKSRTLKGYMKDFIYSSIRYLVNRFSHGSLQNSYDLVTGNYKTKVMHERTHNWLIVSLILIFLMTTLSYSKKMFGKKFIFIVGSFILTFISFFLIFPSYLFDFPLFSNYENSE